METQYYILLFLYLLTITGLWKLFEKAGEKSWKAIVPFYNFYIWLKLIKKPWWWLFLLIVPGINFLMFMIMSFLMAKSFGRKQSLELIIATFAGAVYLPYIGFKQDVVYTGPPAPGEQKTMLKEWGDAILFAVIAATIIRTFFIEAFTIPTSSMEKSLMIGDYLFVSKLSYGPKIPNTPLSFPFAHHTLPGTADTKSYLEWIKLPYLRLPGFTNIKNNNIVVFNYPDGDTVAVNAQDQSYYQLCRDYGRENVWKNELINPQTGKEVFGKVVARPVDKRENYIKRCVAIAGDTLLIVKKNLTINGKLADMPQEMQFNYKVKPNEGGISPKILEKLDITDPVRYNPDSNYFEVTLPFENIEKLKSFSSINAIEPIIEDSGLYNDRIFPHNPAFRWNVDNFGPLVIPKKGATVSIDTVNIVLYDRIIDVYENNDLKIQDGKIFINGKESKSYTFKMDYYFMMGDNRHNSADSRYWGFVPEDHIVGKAVFVWMSLKQNTPFANKFRWNRFFTFVHNEGLSRSYFSVFLVIVGLITAVSYFLKKRKEKISKS